MWRRSCRSARDRSAVSARRLLSVRSITRSYSGPNRAASRRWRKCRRAPTTDIDRHQHERPSRTRVNDVWFRIGAYPRPLGGKPPVPDWRHGPDLPARGRGVPRRDPGLARGEPAGRLGRPRLRARRREERAQFQRTGRRKLYEGGWICAAWPEEYGGKGLSLDPERRAQRGVRPRRRADARRLLRRHARRPDDPAVGERGAEEGVPAQDPVGARSRGARGSREPDAGSDLAGLKTRAVLDGDEWVINGQKVWTTQAQYADYVFLLARTDPDAPKHAGISYLLVPMKQDGIEVPPDRPARRVGRVQRGVLHRRPLPEGERRRRREQRLEGGDDDARFRARLERHHEPPPLREGVRPDPRGGAQERPHRRPDRAPTAWCGSGRRSRSCGSTGTAR